jgi:hypothetical protein
MKPIIAMTAGIDATTLTEPPPAPPGPGHGGLLPLARVGGSLYVLPNALHFFPGNPPAAPVTPAEAPA